MHSKRYYYEDPPSRRSPVTCCTKLCNFFSSFWLQIFNFIDAGVMFITHRHAQVLFRSLLQLINRFRSTLLAVGAILLAFGIYVKVILPDDGGLVEHQMLFWVSLTSFVLGVLFILVALFSFCGIVSNSCRFAVVPSGYLALMLAVVSLSAGIAAILFDEEILVSIHVILFAS